jgi:hypothetical protein
VNGADKVNYWRKGFDLVLAIAATRKKKRSMMDRCVGSVCAWLVMALPATLCVVAAAACWSHAF